MVVDGDRPGSVQFERVVARIPIVGYSSWQKRGTEGRRVELGALEVVFPRLRFPNREDSARRRHFGKLPPSSPDLSGPEGSNPPRRPFYGGGNPRNPAIVAIPVVDAGFAVHHIWVAAGTINAWLIVDSSKSSASHGFRRWANADEYGQALAEGSRGIFAGCGVTLANDPPSGSVALLRPWTEVSRVSLYRVGVAYVSGQLPPTEALWETTTLLWMRRVDGRVFRFINENAGMATGEIEPQEGYASEDLFNPNRIACLLSSSLSIA
ncbi:hypothetical protein ANO11243_082940 [Dothideomycetidae sp. 11243]|nr:hypothetical protein ANO11243_082940 [fungal sp. No.11243]